MPLWPSVSIIPTRLTDVLQSTLPNEHWLHLVEFVPKKLRCQSISIFLKHGYLGTVDMDQHETFMSIVRAYASKTYCISTAYLFASSLCLEVERGMELCFRVWRIQMDHDWGINIPWSVNFENTPEGKDVFCTQKASCYSSESCHIFFL